MWIQLLVLDLISGAGGGVTPATPATAGRGGKKKRKYAEINGQKFWFEHVDQLYAELDRIKQAIPELAVRKARKIGSIDEAKSAKAPSITVQLPDYSEPLEQINRHIAKLNEQVAEIYRTNLIREAQKRIDNENAIIALLMA